MFSLVFETYDWRGIFFLLSLVDMNGKLRFHEVHAIL